MIDGVIDVTVQRGLAIAGTLGLLMFVFELVRRKHLSERYAILWLLAAATLFVLAAWKGLLTSLSHDVGIYYPPSALFSVAIALIVILLMYFSLVVSRLSDQNKMLAQRMALLQQRLESAEALRAPDSEQALDEQQRAQHELPSAAPHSAFAEELSTRS